MDNTLDISGTKSTVLVVVYLVQDTSLVSTKDDNKLMGFHWTLVPTQQGYCMEIVIGKMFVVYISRAV